MAKRNTVESSLEISVVDALSHIEMLGPHTSSMLWGEPGIGKTDSLMETFEKKGYEIIPVLAGCSEPTDFTGIPFPYTYKGEQVALDYLGPKWAWRCSTIAVKEDQGPKVLFFDDIVTAHEQTQAACYKLVDERRLGDLKLRDNVFIIGAGNRVDDKSAVTDMPLALANRFKHYYVKADFEAWEKWALRKGIYPNIVAFLRNRKEHLTEFAKVIESGSPQKAFATPRTWEMLSNSLHILEKNGAADNRQVYLSAAGTVGPGIATEFAAFVTVAEGLVSPEEIVKSPKKARIPKPSEIDILHATVSALEFHIRNNVKDWKPISQYIVREEMQAEFGLLVAKQIVTFILSEIEDNKKNEIINTPEFLAMYEKWQSYLAPIRSNKAN